MGRRVLRTGLLALKNVTVMGWVHLPFLDKDSRAGEGCLTW